MTETFFMTTCTTISPHDYRSNPNKLTSIPKAQHLPKHIMQLLRAHLLRSLHISPASTAPISTAPTIRSTLAIPTTAPAADTALPRRANLLDAGHLACQIPAAAVGEAVEQIAKVVRGGGVCGGARLVELRVEVYYGGLVLGERSVRWCVVGVVLRLTM